jgi:hypothetical protein
MSEKGGCTCFFCILKCYKDLWYLVRKVCGTTLNLINDANSETCIPLLMVQAAHSRDHVGYLKRHFPYLLDICYLPEDFILGMWLIRNKFYRDQVTFHHALAHRQEEYARLLKSSGCPVVIYRKAQYHTNTRVGEQEDLWGIDTPFFHQEWMRAIRLHGKPDGFFRMEKVCVFNNQDELINTTRILGVDFVAYRNVKEEFDMEIIFRAELEWPRKYSMVQQKKQKALRALYAIKYNE